MSEQPLRNISNCISDFTHNTQSSSYLTPLQLPQTPNEMKFVFIALLRRFIEVKVISHFTSPKWALLYLVRPTILKYWQQAKAPPPVFHSKQHIKFYTLERSSQENSIRNECIFHKHLLKAQPRLSC